MKTRDKIRLVQYGVGVMGSEMVKLMLKKQGIKIVGAIASPKSPKVGKDLGEIVGIDKHLGVIVSDDPDAVFAKTKPDVVLIATVSRLEELFPQVVKAVQAKANVIGIGEGLVYPKYYNPELAQKIDELAKEHGVSVLGTGINPGFILDTFIITLTGVCMDIKKIKATRITDFSPFGPVVMRHFGFGLTKDEFERGIEDGSITLLMSISASISMIADSVGWKLKEIKETREPIVSKTLRETPYIRIEPGKVAGFKQSCHGITDDDHVIIIEYMGLIRPEIDGVEASDHVLIDGTPRINLSIKPALDGYMGTVGIAVNMIPKVVNAKPGLLTMKDLPIPSAVFGDVRTFVNINRIKKVE